MNTRQKILDVITRIKNESEINANPTTVRFDFNHYVVGAGFLSADEEMRILSKLQNENWIHLNLPTDEEGIVTSNTPEDYMADRDHVTLQLLPGFSSRYQLFKLLTFSSQNRWNYVNPPWLLWKIFTLIINLIKRLVTTVFQHWLVSFVIAVLGLLAIDYALAWRNMSVILDSLKTTIGL